MSFVYKGSTYHVVVIEGIDCVGKGTFAKSVYESIKTSIAEDKDSFAYLLSFPDYESRSGREVKEILTKGPLSQDDEDTLNMLMAQNRSEAFNNLFKLVDNLNVNGCVPHNIYLVLDRSWISGFIYKICNIIKNHKDKDILKKAMESCNNDAYSNGYVTLVNVLQMFGTKAIRAYNALADEVDSYNDVDVLVQMNRDLSDPRSTQAHLATMDYRAEKEGKDSYENDENQEIVANLYYLFRNVFASFYKDYNDDNYKVDMFIPFGVNFGTNTYENMILKKLNLKELASS